MSLKEEIFSDDFPEYRKMEIEKMAEVFSYVIRNGGSHPEYIRGAMHMARIVLNIPKNLARTPEQIEFISKRLEEDFARFEVEYLRRAIRDE